MVRTDGMPRDTARCLRIGGDSFADPGAFGVAEPGQVTLDAADEPPDPGDLFLGGGGVGAGPLIDPVDGGGEPFPGA